MDWGAFAGASVGGFVLVLIGGILSHYAFKRYWKKKALLREDVESPPEVDDGEKEEVRQKLQAAIDSRDPEELRTGLERADALNMKEQVVTDARQVLKEEKDEAKKMLRDAVASRDPEGLRTAIAKGEALRLKDEEGLGAARRVLEEEKVAARKELQDAIQAREIDRLRRAIARGLALQLKPGELVEAQRILKELEKEEKKKKKPKKVTTQQEEPLAREPTESMEADALGCASSAA
ncbi:unnamed protein product [Durusdinium trenchii]|uniref:Uncharacterized protein n=1 Tax=Durusdinium trenchii TaxID=1381693 RepID=A0ABP0NZN1_9DINO